MLADYQNCYEIIQKYFESVADPSDPYEDSELLLFQNQSLELSQKYTEALEHLEKFGNKIVDKHSLRIQRARLQLFSGTFSNASELWAELLKEEPENEEFHAGLQLSVLESDTSTAQALLQTRQNPILVFELSPAQKKNILQYYQRLSLKGRTISKIEISLTLGTEEFVPKLRHFLRHSLEVGIPSTIQDVTMLAGFNKTNKAASQFQDIVVQSSMEIIEELLSSESILPITMLWAMHLKACLSELSGKFTQALEVLDVCLDHTPTAVDIYVKKVEILEKLGKVAVASDVAEECRRLDLQDRYLNNCSTKYLLRADKTEAGKETIALFTKHDGEPEKTLSDLQCCWYQLEVADSLARQKNWQQAIGKYSSVRQHFKDHFNELFDFHGYCNRKVISCSFLLNILNGVHHFILVDPSSLY
jgi:predicted Zn-dependent protease